MSKNNYCLELLSVESIHPGLELKPVSFQIDSSQIFMFSAATWNRHKIHYDQTQAKKEGYSDVLVQRGLIGNLFTRFIQNLFTNVFIQQLDWKVISSAMPKDKLSCSGKIIEVINVDGNSVVTISATIINKQKQIISEASAIIRDITNVDLIKPTCEI